MPEIMEISGGKCPCVCRVQQSAQTYGAGEKVSVPGNSSFDSETLDYVCHFG